MNCIYGSMQISCHWMYQKQIIYMIFGNRRINCDMDIQIHNDQITRVSKTKLFGVWIDEKLTWKDQINNVKTNLSRLTGVMPRASHVLGTTSLLTLYYSLFLPILCYCCEVLGNACITNVHCITVVQKRWSDWYVVLVDSITPTCYFIGVELKFQDLKMYSIMYKTYNNMPVSVNVQCFFMKHANLSPSRVQCQYVCHCICTNIKSRCISIWSYIIYCI